MRIDLDRNVLDPKGQPITDGGSEPRDLTLADIVYIALTQSPKAGKEGRPADKRTRGRLAQRIARGGVQDFAEADIAVVREDCEAMLAAAALVGVEDALEPVLDLRVATSEVP